MARNNGIGSPEMHLGAACNHLKEAYSESVALLSAIGFIYEMHDKHKDPKLLAEQFASMRSQFERTVRATVAESEHERFIKANPATTGAE